eukprot:TRINITY_DN16619_c0_g1_i1.p1 TRINITY_DN16619_c0_g1~~TRINITY_DN16619_c0_g1_i1.p1  ORF type:complete len:229 (+),score=39.65 TRINITY_DN16619_c0_g1_i1:1-687(+)
MGPGLQQRQGRPGPEPPQRRGHEAGQAGRAQDIQRRGQGRTGRQAVGCRKRTGRQRKRLARPELLALPISHRTSSSQAVIRSGFSPLQQAAVVGLAAHVRTQDEVASAELVIKYVGNGGAKIARGQGYVWLGSELFQTGLNGKEVLLEGVVRAQAGRFVKKPLAHLEFVRVAERVRHLAAPHVQHVEALQVGIGIDEPGHGLVQPVRCLLYTSPSPRDRQKSRMPSSA